MKMSLYDDIAKILKKFIGNESIEVISKFEDPDSYPNEFLDESIYFLSRIIGEKESLIIFDQIIKKYKHTQ